MTTHEQNDTAGEQPTEAARTLHGDKARAEQYDQPADTVALDSETLVARPGRDKTAVEGDEDTDPEALR
jgi:hypothetical protein